MRRKRKERKGKERKGKKGGDGGGGVNNDGILEQGGEGTKTKAVDYGVDGTIMGEYYAGLWGGVLWGYGEERGKREEGRVSLVVGVLSIS